MPIEVKKIRVEGNIVHVTGLVDGKLVEARGAAYPYTVGKTPVHKRRYLEQLLTAALVNAAHKDEPTHVPGAVDLPGSFVTIAEWLKTRIEDHERRIMALEQKEHSLQSDRKFGTFWQRLRWLFTGK